MTHTIASNATIRAAAELVDGQHLIRGTTMARLLGVKPGSVTDWISSGRLVPVWVERPRSRHAPKGRAQYFPLNQALAMVKRRQTDRRKQRWTEQEMAELVAMAGVMSIEQIAKRLRRPPIAVVRMLRSMRIRPIDVVLEQHGLVKTSTLAKIVGHRNSNIVRWVRKHGCPHRRLADRRGLYLFNLAEVRTWLATRWCICVALDPAVLRRLGLRLDGGRVVIEQPQFVGGAA